MKFQQFLLDEFARLFRLYADLEKKELETSEKLVRALEKCDSLEYDIQKLHNELSEYHDFDNDL